MVSNTVDDCLQKRITKKIFKSKIKLIEARPVNAGHYMAFNFCISFAIDLAANFGCERFRITPDLVSKLFARRRRASQVDVHLKSLCGAAILSRCAVRFESEQTPFPRTGRRLRSAALHRIRFGTCELFQCHIFTQRPMTDRWALVGNNFSPIPSKISFHIKKVTRRGPIFTKHESLFDSGTGQYRKSGSMFSSSEPVAARSDYRRLGNALCLRSPLRPAQAVPESGPKSSVIDLTSKPSIAFWNSLRRYCQMTCSGSNLDSNLKSAA